MTLESLRSTLKAVRLVCPNRVRPIAPPTARSHRKCRPRIRTDAIAGGRLPSSNRATERLADYVVAWCVPGVLVGGTVGTRVGKFVPEDAMEIGLGVIFGAVGVLVLVVKFVA